MNPISRLILSHVEDRSGILTISIDNLQLIARWTFTDYEYVTRVARNFGLWIESA
jgi:hypothetical protein